MEFYKNTFYKITNCREIHQDHVYKDGLNILNKPFDQKGSCTPGGLYFTTLEHIHKFYDYGCFLREITLPVENPEFRVVKDPEDNKYRANMILLGKKYSLSDPKTFEKFGLELPPIKTLATFACQEGSLERLKWAVKNGFVLNTYICHYAAQNGHLKIIKWACESGCPWDNDVCNSAALGGHLEIIKWACERGCPWDKHICSIAALQHCVAI